MKSIAIIILLFSFLSGLLADDWEEISKVAKNIKSVSANFTQEKHMKMLAKPLVSKGRFFFSAPNSLRWEYLSPIKSILMMHNGKARSYMESKKGLVEDTRAKAQAMEIVMQEITSWLNGRFHDDPNFKPTLITGKVDKIVLTPKDKSLSNIINSIELQISRREGIIKSVKISENNDSYTLLLFSDVDHNKNIDERMFRDVK